MPLAHESLSHGTVAFGFFQIESHMLLLNELYFFADDFCAAVERLADQDGASLPGWRITDRTTAGDLHGAIAGRDHRGFIGATYRLWPFPAEQAKFRQNPDGHQTRATVTDLIVPVGAAEDFALQWDHDADELALAEYIFDPAGFRSLLDYVARGGYPRYTGDRRPDYVQRMLARVANVW